MATYVNNLRLKEIATGAESGTWGTSTNTNLELIADAFGSGTEAITTNADTHTTTVADGAADEGRAIYMKYTGTLDSACTITLAPDTINKFWIIENATSGSQNILIKQGSGGGAAITIGNGKVAAVFTDGAGSGAIVYDAFADLELSSTLTVAGNVDFNGDLDVDGTTNLDAVDIDGAVQIDSTITVGADDTGYDVKFFGDTASAYMLWDTSTDDLVLAGAAGIDLAGDIDVDGTANLDIVDIDGAVDMASTLTLAGNADFNGDLDVDGTTNLDVVDIDGAVDMASTLAVTGDTTISGDIVVSGTGPHAIGGTTIDYARLRLTGNFTSGGNSSRASTLRVDSTLTGAVGDTSALVGSSFQSIITTQGTDTNIGYVAQVEIHEPSITNNLASSGKPDVAASLYIHSAPDEGDVNAALYVAAGAVNFKGTLAVTGSVSKGSGSFKIDHPLPAKTDTHHLVHSFIEGPRADLIYRGTVDLSGGWAQVDLDEAAGMSDGTWELLCRDPQVWMQNDSGWSGVRGSVEGSTLTIECKDTVSDDTVSWMVVAERCDQHMYDTGWTDDDGRVIVEPEKGQGE